jgi:superfamily II DNA or RNA helicase
MITFDYDKSYRKGRLICDESMLSFIRNRFSVKNPNASFANKKLRLKGSNYTIPERDYAISKIGAFDMGMYEEIRSFLRGENIIDLECTQEFSERVICGFGDVVIKDLLKFPLRDYQAECITRCMKLGRGTVISATGSGKSLIQASLVDNWKILTRKPFKCLIIVPGVALVHQLLKDFGEYGVKCSYSGWTGDMEKQDTEVVIVNTELLCSQFGNFKELVDVDLVLRDECHGTRAENVVTKIIGKIKTPNKFGFTGTMPKDKMDEWKIIGTFGEIIFEKSSKELRDEKYLSNALIRIIGINHPCKVRGYKQELEFIQTDENRHKVIKKLTSKLEKNVLILVNRIEHGDNLYETLQIEGKETFFVHGGVSVDDRLKIIEKMEAQDNVICIAMSSIFSTGINIKNLHYVVFAAGGKSFVRIIQSIGRGLRLHESKEKFVLFDIYDNFKFSMEHVEERKKFYDEEQIPWREVSVEL